MPNLELKIIPPLVALLAALLMAGLSWLMPISALPASVLPLAARVGLALLCMVLGVVTSLSGALLFRRVKTSINPSKPLGSSVLVRTGIYARTRNPMYLGIALVLLGCAIGLANGAALLGLLGFVWYITCFQIVPEEKALLAIFGADFVAYKATVRRWL